MPKLEKICHIFTGKKHILCGTGFPLPTGHTWLHVYEVSNGTIKRLSLYKYDYKYCETCYNDSRLPLLILAAIEI
jgi:hypothetical protein